ncbi:hypothetical protein C8Q77DRAFT_1056476 [Trametes polyzona]|nr:hypothetical protein C8Q77DRAFT_1056476 [Trametes polyzona]
MELVMFGDEDDEDDFDEGDDLAIEWARRLSAMESPLEYPPRSPSRPHAGRHVSDSAVPSAAEMLSPTSMTLGEYDALHPEHYDGEDSAGSEAEWEGWLEGEIAQRRRVHLAASRSIHRTDTLETAIPGDLYWGTGSGAATPSSALSTPEHEKLDPWTQSQPREGDVELGNDDEASSAQGPGHARSSRFSYLQRPPPRSSSRGRHAKRRAPATDRTEGPTLSSYSSVDSLFKRTMRSAMGGTSKAHAQAKRVSISSADLTSGGRTSSDHAAPRSASASPPLSRPSMASLRSTGSTRSRPQSPLCAQVHDSPDAPQAASSQEGAHRAGDGSRHHHHPIPLPGMPIVPSGPTTFRHSALYGRRSGARGSPAGGDRGGLGSSVGPGMGAGPGSDREEQAHAGLVHGQSMQRLPVPMSMMMTTVSSTVSVGNGKTSAASR